MARTIIGNITLSLDGRVAGPDGENDMAWLYRHAVSDGVRTQFAEILRSVDTVLLGRINFEGFQGYWPPVAEDESADPRDRALAKWLNDVEKVVVSTTLTGADWKNSRVVNAEPAQVARELRQAPGRDVVVLSSVSVINALLEADELDRLVVALCPELLGQGKPLFREGLPRSTWALTSSSQSETGAVTLVYDRVREAG